MTGFSIELWAAIAEQAELDYEIQQVDTITDLLDTLRDGEADLGIGGISITSERETTLDFSYPIFNSGLEIMVREGKSIALLNIFQILLTPALLQVLAGLAVIILIAAHVVWLVERSINPEFPRSYIPGIWEGIWWATVTTVTVGYGDRTPRTTVGRLFAIILMFAGVALVAQFTAVVTTQFTLQQLRGDVGGLDDLYGKRVVTVSGSTASDYLQSIRMSAIRVENIDEAYQRLMNEQADAIIYDTPVLLYYAATEGRGQVHLIGDIFAREDYGIAFPHDSPYREMINQAILQVVENGTYQDLYDRWFA